MRRLDGLRIALVLEATGGGTRKHVRELAFGMKERGAEVFLAVSPGREPDYGRDIAAFRRAGMRVAVLPMRREVRPFRDGWCAGMLFRELRRFRPDVVHSHGAKAGGTARAAAPLMRGTGFVHTPHTLPFEWAGNIAAPVYRTIEGVLGLWTDLFVALSVEQARKLAVSGVVRPGGRIAVIPNGVRRPRAFSRKAAREGLGLEEGAFVVMQVARLAPQKSCGTFLRAASLLRGAEGVVFVLVGDGPLRKELERLRTDLELDEGRFRFAGYVPEAARYFPAADVVVLSSLYEGLPYVVLEAGSLGLPVVVSDIPGMREVVEDGETGLLVPPGSAEAVAGAVKMLLEDEQLAGRLGRRARERVARRFTLERFLERHAEAYLGVAGR